MATDAEKRIIELEQQIAILQDTSRQSNLVRKRYQDALAVLKEKDLALKKSNQRIEKDFDTLKRMQQELVEKEKMAALGLLVAGVAHEVNTPIGVAITSISTCNEAIRHLKKLYRAEDLSENDLEMFLETADESVRLVRESLDQAVRLIRSFKQISVDQNIDDIRQFDVCEYLSDIIRTFRSQLKKTKIQIDIECRQGMMVKTYPGSLAQILNNLLANVINYAYSPGQQGKVLIRVDLENDQLHLLFADEGKGMEEGIKERAFQPFVTTGRDKGGSGLGLNIVYNLVTQRFGGQIKLESQKGAGSRFFITLVVMVPG
ncbi:MAG: HAMP domain-containing histidine kinase [Candidatus Thiodiazotropha sp. (ex Epidulcina cf. delphinae)]|nr:HAMP domain-containing histidine kinase [Candidatus Thiodiazotropha sp. (ex Epidulcina cf. delphinae)]